MTWSIVAFDPQVQAFAIAVTSRALAVGANCPFLRSGVGAVSTQSLTNRYLGPAILDGLARGLAPQAAIESALAGDEGKHLRQVHAIDRHGRAAAWTGKHCVDYCGSAQAPFVSVAGNMLAGDAVIADTLAAFLDRSDLPLSERAVAALAAGQAAGGDRRGRQSAALLLTTTEDFPDVDLRVDDHSDPLSELQRLLGVWRANVAPGLAQRPRRANPSGWTDLDAIDAAWEKAGFDFRLRR